LAASVYTASEGLSVVTIDSKAPSGQADKSLKIISVFLPEYRAAI
jgi:thioredoxin reductase (NADPH)